MENLTETILEQQENCTSYYQCRWDKFLDYIDHDEYTLWIYGTAIITTLVFWVFGGLYLLLDTYKWPKFIQNFKLELKNHKPIDNSRLKSALKLIAFNQLVVGIIFLRLLFEVMKLRGYQPTNVLPSFPRIIYEVFVCSLFPELKFYYSQRKLLWNKIYNVGHKEYPSVPMAIMCLYNHPFDHVFSNLIPITFGVVFMKCHVVTVWIWLSIVTLVTLSDHSGYHLPLMPKPEAHYYHYYKFDSITGFLGLFQRPEELTAKSEDLKSKTHANGSIPSKETDAEEVNGIHHYTNGTIF